MTQLLRVEDLTKRFAAVTANDRVSFDLEAGEIHCLLGQNGAGKTTLCECLYGYCLPDSGSVYLEGQEVDIRSPSDAIKLGIGMVHQHFVLVTPMTVLENIVVGTEELAGIPNMKDAKKRIREVCDTYGLDIDLEARIWQISVGEQQWVEVLKALYTGARILILDEPTAALTPQESEKLFHILRRMTAQGLSVVLVSHKLNEVMESDRVTVLRQGRVVGTVRPSEVTKLELSRMVVGREVDLRVEKSLLAAGEPILEIRNLCVLSDKGQRALNDFSLTVRRHEIVGIAGVAGNGQKELFEALVGVRPIESGEIRIGDKDLTHARPKEIADCGVGYIPDDRYGAGLIPEFSVAENLILGRQDEDRFNNGFFVRRDAVNEFATDSMRDFEIMAPSHKTVTSTLSGGNAQKVILARELAQCEICLLANQPTRGLDVGVIEYVHQQLLAKREQGIAILLASEDLEEIFNLSDRIATLFKGEIMGILNGDEASVEKIGLMMGGTSAESTAEVTG